jgi:uncharacterized membrane protein YfcA
MLGIGGGSLIVPLLILGFGFEAQTAIGTSLFVVLLTAISSTIAYFRERLIDYKIALILSVGTIPGGIVGAYITRFLSSSWLIMIFSIFLVLMSTKMFMGKKQVINSSKENERKNQGFKRYLIDTKGRIYNYNVILIPGIIASCAAGFISGLLGIGGGTVMVPAMVLLMGVPMHLAISNSMFIICLASSAGIAIHWNLEHISLNYVLILTVGTILGAQIGARLASKLKPELLKQIFSITLLIIAIRMFILGITTFL